MAVCGDFASRRQHAGIVHQHVHAGRREVPREAVHGAGIRHVDQGEAGATSSPHYSAPISSQAWNSELTQCKWNARRMLGDLGHGLESLVFTFYDPAYDQPERYCKRIDPLWVRTRQDRFMKRMGLVKCNEDGQVLTVSLGADHRVTDGRLGAQFLARIAVLLADPGSL